MNTEGPSRTSLKAVPLALALVAVIFFLGTMYARRIERQAIHTLAYQTAVADEKDNDPAWLARSKSQGMALQRAAFAQPDLLPIYGSSELLKPIPERASVFFRSYPSGFEVFPIGKAGTTSLITAQKLAAVGPAAHGRKAVILISPGWFFTAIIEGRYYEGNFSRQQASAAIFSRHLSLALKAAAARRLLAHPGTLQGHPILAFAASHLATGKPLDRFLYALSVPLGWLQNAVFFAQDHFEAASSITIRHLTESAPSPREPRELNWPELLAEASRNARRIDRPASPWSADKAANDASFRETMTQSTEWLDLDLLLQTTKELGVETLLVCMPADGWYFEPKGVSRATLDLFSQRLHQAAQQPGVHLVTFDDYLEDPTFLIDHHDHLTGKGWMYINQAIDRFFHEGPAATVR